MSLNIPIPKEIPSTSPSSFEVEQHKRQYVNKWAMLKSIFHQKPIANSFRWSFVSASLISFLALYHTNGQILRSFTHGFIAFSIIFYIKFYTMQQQERHEFYRNMQAYTGEGERLAKAEFATNKVLGVVNTYDMRDPYSEAETQFLHTLEQRRRKWMYYGGACGGGMLLTGSFFSKRLPWWGKLTLMSGGVVLGAAVASFLAIQQDIVDLYHWKEPGKLSQETQLLANSNILTDRQAHRIKELEMHRKLEAQRKAMENKT